VEGRRVRDYLNVVGVVEIGVRDGNCSPILDGDRLGKRGSEVGIGGTAIANEPTGVDV
jgi:hypothetical protein